MSERTKSFPSKTEHHESLRELRLSVAFTRGTSWSAMVMPSSARSSLVLQATATCFRLLPVMLILQNVELVLSNDAETVAFLYPHNLPALGVIGGGMSDWLGTDIHRRGNSWRPFEEAR